jgi:hypothetical protein
VHNGSTDGGFVQPNVFSNFRFDFATNPVHEGTRSSFMKRPELKPHDDSRNQASYDGSPYYGGDQSRASFLYRSKFFNTNSRKGTILLPFKFLIISCNKYSIGRPHDNFSSFNRFICIAKLKILYNII